MMIIRINCNPRAITPPTTCQVCNGKPSFELTFEHELQCVASSHGPPISRTKTSPVAGNRSSAEYKDECENDYLFLSSDDTVRHNNKNLGIVV